jgi:O-antigen/teichoic acid export membrane protein
VPEEQVAGYVLSYQIASNTVGVPLMIFMTIYFPALIRTERTVGMARALQMNRSTCARYALCCPAAAVLLIPFQAFFLSAMYSDYSTSTSVIAVIFVAHLVSGFGHFFNKEFELSEATIVITKSIAAGAACNVAFNIALIPSFGVIGAAISTLVGYSMMIFVVSSRSSSMPRLRIRF